MDDAEFNSRMHALDSVLDRHLGPPSEDVGEVLDAEYVMMALWLPAAGLGAMNAEHERKKLKKARRLAQELAETWDSIHPDIRSKIELLSLYIYETTDRRSADPLYLGTITSIPELLDRLEPIAQEIIDVAPRDGRRALENVAVVERLREVWFQRKDETAPKSMTEAGPFAEYMIDAFDALGLSGNVRGAVDSWRTFRAKYPDTL